VRLWVLDLPRVESVVPELLKVGMGKRLGGASSSLLALNEGHCFCCFLVSGC
jgi:hypothetical protein